MVLNINGKYSRYLVETSYYDLKYFKKLNLICMCFQKDKLIFKNLIVYIQGEQTI